MRPWLIMFGAGLALIGLQAVQAQVTIDITEITCNQFLGSQITDSRTLGIWLNGYVNGERGKRLIHPLSPGHISLVNYCESHMDTLIWMLPEMFLVPTNSYLAFMSAPKHTLGHAFWIPHEPVADGRIASNFFIVTCVQREETCCTRTRQVSDGINSAVHTRQIRFRRRSNAPHGEAFDAAWKGLRDTGQPSVVLRCHSQTDYQGGDEGRARSGSACALLD